MLQQTLKTIATIFNFNFNLIDLVSDLSGQSFFECVVHGVHFLRDVATDDCVEQVEQI